LNAHLLENLPFPLFAILRQAQDDKCHGELVEPFLPFPHSGGFAEAKAKGVYPPATKLQYAGFGTPLTKEQLKKMAMPMGSK
jgi:hypothetical protein